MSQITSCPACATMFKVVDGQLQVAQGWVRCGQCGEVFEASLHFVAGGTGEAEARPDSAGLLPQSEEMDAGVPLMAPGAAPGRNFAGPAAHAEPMQFAASERPDVPGMPLSGEKPVMPAHPAGLESFNLMGGSEDRLEPEFNANGFDFRSTPDTTGPEPQDSEAFPDVAFLREAQRKDFWKSTMVRAALAVMCLVLALALMLQWAVRQKDTLAAQAPQLAPWFQAMCRPLGCAVRPLRRIESLVIENASFSRTGPDAYRLSFAFKNTGAAELEVPALEVTLTDSQDQAVVRRVVMPAEFGATAATLAAYSSLAGTLSLKIAGAGGPESAPAAKTTILPVAGYRILAFYP